MKKLLEKLAKLAKDMRSMYELAESEDRGFTPEEREQWDEMQSDYEALEARIEAARTIEGQRSFESDALPTFDREQRDLDDDNEEAAELSRAEGRETDEYRAAFDSFLREGSVTREQRELLNRYEAVFSNDEQRAQATTPGSAGGFTIPEGFAGFITERMQDFSGIYQDASNADGPTLLPTQSGNLIPFPTNDDTGNAGTIIAENTEVTEQDTVFGQRNLTAYMYTSRLIRVSLQLLQDEAVNLEAYLGNILGKRLGRAVSPHLARGSGSSEPTGLVTAATDAGVDISLAAGVTYDDLLDLEHALDPAYRNRGAKWVFNDNTYRGIKGLVDANDRPIWMPADIAGLQGAPGRPTLLGYRYVIDQGLEDIAVGSRPIAFGDLTEYYIREVLGVTLFRFNERYMDHLQIGFMGYARWDGNLIDTGAVVTDVAVA